MEGAIFDRATADDADSSSSNIQVSSAKTLVAVGAQYEVKKYGSTHYLAIRKTGEEAVFEALGFIAQLTLPPYRKNWMCVCFTFTFLTKLTLRQLYEAEPSDSVPTHGRSARFRVPAERGRIRHARTVYVGIPPTQRS